MGIALKEEMILGDIIKSCKRLFGFQVVETVPIKRGWLNLKWKVTTDSGIFLVKQYNKERYKKYSEEELLRAFSEQTRLYKKGFPCPGLCSHGGQFLFDSDLGERFLVMEYCRGKNVVPGKLNVHQMKSLGQATGIMHKTLNDGTLEMKMQPEFLLPSRGERLSHWDTVLNNARDAGKSHVLPIIKAQYMLTEMIDFEKLHIGETGWAHRDLWVDNLLFQENKLAAVLDFDRLKYDYPQLDVARAVISGALDEKNLDVSLSRAFLKGYSKHQVVEKGFLTNALKLLWMMESTWWLDSDLDQRSGPPNRFVKEMIWLSENYVGLESMLGDM